MAFLTVSLETRNVRADGNCLQLALQAAASDEQQRRLLTRKALADQLVQQLREDMAAADDPWTCLTACCMAFQVCESQHHEYRDGWWLEEGRTTDDVIAAIRRHVCTQGKWLGDPVLKLGAEVLGRPVVVFKHVRNRSAVQAQIEPLVVLPGGDAEHALVDVKATIYRAGAAAPIATFTAKNAAWPHGPAPLYLLLEAHMVRGQLLQEEKEEGHHYSNLVLVEGRADGGAEPAEGGGSSSRPQRAAAPASFAGMDDDGHDSGSSEDERMSDLVDESESGSDQDHGQEEEEEDEQPQPPKRAKRQGRQPARKRARASAAPAAGEEQEGGGAARSKKASKKKSSRNGRLVYVWDVPAPADGLRYVATVTGDGADLGLCWLWRTGATPRLLRLRLAAALSPDRRRSAEFLVAEGHVPPARLPGTGVTPARADLRQLGAGRLAGLRGVLPRTCWDMVLASVRLEGSEEAVEFDVTTFEADNQSILLEAEALARRVAEDGPEMPHYNQDDHDEVDTAEQARQQDRRRKPGQESKYYSDMFDKALAAIERALAVAALQRPDQQAYRFLQELAQCDGDVKGTAFEVATAVRMAYKGELRYSRADPSKRATVVEVRGRPGIWISRAPRGCHLCMQLHDMQAVAAEVSGDPEERETLVEVMKDVMTNDVGFDLLVVARADADVQARLVFVQCKYRASFKMPASALYEYLGKFQAYVTGRLEDGAAPAAVQSLSQSRLSPLVDRLPPALHRRAHFMWASNQQNVELAKLRTKYTDTLFHTYYDFKTDWADLQLGIAMLARAKWFCDQHGEWVRERAQMRPRALTHEQRRMVLAARGHARKCSLAPTGLGKTLVAIAEWMLSGVAANASDLYERALDAMCKSVELTAEDAAAVCNAYTATLETGLVPMVTFLTSITLCSQFLENLYVEHARWSSVLERHDLRLPRLRCVLCCSAEEAPGNTGDITCMPNRDLFAWLHARHDGRHGGDKHCIVTTVQGALGFEVAAREFALSAGYAYGCDDRGRLLTGDEDADAYRPPLFGCCVNDEAHNQTGVSCKPFTLPQLVSLQLAARSHSLTATPVDEQGRNKAKRWASEVIEQREAERRTEREADRAAAGDEDEDEEEDADVLDELDMDEMPEAAGAESDEYEEERVLHVSNKKFAGHTHLKSGRLVRDRAGQYPASWAVNAVMPWDEKMRRLPLRDFLAFLQDKGARLAYDELEAAHHQGPDALLSFVALRLDRPVLGLFVHDHVGGSGDVHPLKRRSGDNGGNSMKTRGQYVYLTPRVPPKAAPAAGDDAAAVDEGALDGKLLAREDLLVLGLAASEVDLATTLVAQDPANKALATDVDQQPRRGRERSRSRHVDEDDDTSSEDTVIAMDVDGEDRASPAAMQVDEDVDEDGEEADGDGDKRRDQSWVALFPHDLGVPGAPRPRGLVVHDQSGVTKREAADGADRASEWNGNGHGTIASATRWVDAATARDRKPDNNADVSTVLPLQPDPAKPLFVPWLDSTVADIYQPRTPREDTVLQRLLAEVPAAAAEAGPDQARQQALRQGRQVLAYMVRRLLVRCLVEVKDARRFDVVDGSGWDDIAPITTTSTLDEIKKSLKDGLEWITGGECYPLFFQCDLSGRVLETGVPAVPGRPLEGALPVGYKRDRRRRGWEVLFPVGPPERRRPSILLPGLVLMEPPRVPYDAAAMRSFAENLMGLARLRRGPGTSMADWRERFESAAIFVQHSAANTGRREGMSDDEWVDLVLNNAHRDACNQRNGLHPDRRGPGGPQFHRAQEAVERLRAVRGTLTGEQKQQLFQALADAAGLVRVGQDGRRPSPQELIVLAQPQCVKLGMYINGKPYYFTLQHWHAARCIVSAVMCDDVRYRRNKMMVFCETNASAALLHKLVRDILQQQHPEAAAEIYTAHVYGTMSLGKDNGKMTQTAEANQRMLETFKQRPRAILFSCDAVKEGFDAHDVDAVVIAYPCMSPNDIAQMMGRCMRVDSHNPDKHPLVFVPVHDAQAVVHADFGPADAAALDALAAPQSCDDAAAQATPYQTRFDVVRKVWECMLDPGLQVLTRTFLLQHTKVYGAAGGYCEGAPLKELSTTRVMKMMVMRADAGTMEIAPLHLSDAQGAALLAQVQRLQLVVATVCPQTPEDWLGVWSRYGTSDDATGRPPPNTYVFSDPFYGRVSLGNHKRYILEQARGQYGVHKVQEAEAMLRRITKICSLSEGWWQYTTAKVTLADAVRLLPLAIELGLTQPGKRPRQSLMVPDPQFDDQPRPVGRFVAYRLATASGKRKAKAKAVAAAEAACAQIGRALGSETPRWWQGEEGPSGEEGDRLPPLPTVTLADALRLLRLAVDAGLTQPGVCPRQKLKVPDPLFDNRLRRVGSFVYAKLQVVTGKRKAKAKTVAAAEAACTQIGCALGAVKQRWWEGEEAAVGEGDELPPLPAVTLADALRLLRLAVDAGLTQPGERPHTTLKVPDPLFDNRLRSIGSYVHYRIEVAMGKRNAAPMTVASAVAVLEQIGPIVRLPTQWWRTPSDALLPLPRVCLDDALRLLPLAIRDGLMKAGARPAQTLVVQDPLFDNRPRPVGSYVYYKIEVATGKRNATPMTVASAVAALEQISPVLMINCHQWWLQ